PDRGKQEPRSRAAQFVRTGVKAQLLAVERTAGSQGTATRGCGNAAEVAGRRSGTDDRRSEILPLRGGIRRAVVESGEVSGARGGSEAVSETDSRYPHAAQAGAGRVPALPDPQQPAREEYHRFGFHPGE